VAHMPGTKDNAPDPRSQTQEGRPKVVILGGGFGGIGAAKKLKRSDVDIILVDEHNYHTFQPMLYQVATDLLPTSTVGHPLRDLYHEQPNVTVRQATVTGIDLGDRRVRFKEIAPEQYDYLVIGLGARVEFFGVEGAKEHAFPMYTLADAVRLKDHVLSLWERTDRGELSVDDGSLNVVIVGGGPTGVESAGAMAELYRKNFNKDYPNIPQDKARIIVVEAAPELFGMFKSSLRDYAKQALEKRGVEVLLGETVASIGPTRVRLKSGTVLAAHTLVWGAGLRAHPIAGTLGTELQRGDRVVVGPDLSISEHPEVFAVGDIAWITDSKTNEVLPQLGSVALQSGEQAGKNIRLRVEGKEETEPFEYVDKGTMAAIGRGAAVVQLKGGHTIKGKSAYLAWGSVHLALLSTGEDRAKAMVDWTWAGFTHKRAERITVDMEEER
jgi:NADH dehydrogenase